MKTGRAEAYKQGTYCRLLKRLIRQHRCRHHERFRELSREQVTILLKCLSFFLLYFFICSKAPSGCMSSSPLGSATPFTLGVVLLSSTMNSVYSLCGRNCAIVLSGTYSSRSRYGTERYSVRVLPNQSEVRCLRV